MQNHRYLLAQVGLMAVGIYYSTVPIDSLSQTIYQVRDHFEVRNHTAKPSVKCINKLIRPNYSWAFDSTNPVISCLSTFNIRKISKRSSRVATYPSLMQ